MNQTKKTNYPDTLTPHTLSHDGRAIATLLNKTTFLRGALPNEEVTYRILNEKSQYRDAEMTSIVKASEDRIDPTCPHFNLCGGCSLQHMRDALQLTFKQNTLLEQLAHFGQVKPETILPALHAESYRYRRKARLGVKYVIKKEKMLVGFREKSSRYLADLSRCDILHPAVGERFQALSELVQSLSIYQAIPQIEVAIGDETVALVFRHLKPFTEDDYSKLKQFGETFHFQLYGEPNSPEPIYSIWPSDHNEQLSYSLPDHDITLYFQPKDFTQVNLSINRLMVNQAITLLELKPTDQVLDLFCGLGNFTLPIAKYVKNVVGVEGSEEMVNRAHENALANQIHTAEFYSANLMEYPITADWANRQYDKILLDPPRAGAKEILPLIQKISPQRIVYVSCNPATLARDAHELVHTYGYKLNCAGIMNMFPHTAHIEAMALFTKP